jgi:transcriptional regulator with XRE-family HTH domain
MDAGQLIVSARRQAGLSLRELAARAATSHSTIAAYEHHRLTPNVDTLSRVLRAAGVVAEVHLAPVVTSGGPDRGHELVEVLDLASRFPARHGPVLTAPVFGRDR